MCRAVGAGSPDFWVLGGEGAWYPKGVLGAGKNVTPGSA